MMQLSEEQMMFQKVVRHFAQKELKPRAGKIDQEASFPTDLLGTMADIGLLGMAIPEEHGGTSLDSVSILLALEEIAKVCGSTGLSLAAHTGLGCFPIARWGNAKQREDWLPTLAAGKSLGSLCLTEPAAGSDLRSVRTQAVEAGEHWVINGTKAWITNPSLARVFIVYARSMDSFNMILVESDRPGVTVHPAEKKMGVRGSPTHQISFDNVRVPRENLLGKKGKGLQQTLETLDGGRLSIAALSVGIAQGAFEEAVRYAKERVAFNRPISEFQAIQWMLADASTSIDAGRLLLYRAARLKDAGHRFTKEASMAKLFASEMAERVSRDAIQILGSYGYSQEFSVERMYRDARLMTIGEGTSEIQRMVIARYLLA